ncbi:MAG: TadE/TadG family type IV pilus assembly protein [Rhodopila sp.]
MTRLIADRRGVAALEFAIVGGTFFLLLLLVIQFGLYFVQVTALDLAVQKASRQILINQPVTQTQFVANIQADSFGLLQSQTIQVAVQSADSFGAITPVANIAGGGSLPYNTGTYGSAVLVQVGYTGNAIANLLSQFVPGVSSTIAFQREPSPQ